MSLFGSLYIGNSGLQTSQNALNTTAHNMTNADTRVYVSRCSREQDSIIQFQLIPKP